MGTGVRFVRYPGMYLLGTRVPGYRIPVPWYESHVQVHTSCSASRLSQKMQAAENAGRDLDRKSMKEVQSFIEHQQQIQQVYLNHPSPWCLFDEILVLVGMLLRAECAPCLARSRPSLERSRNCAGRSVFLSPERTSLNRRKMYDSFWTCCSTRIECSASGSLRVVLRFWKYVAVEMIGLLEIRSLRLVPRHQRIV